MMVVASAPGKVILFGEHAVVYGVPAIAAALSDLRLYVTITTSKKHQELKVSFMDILDGDCKPTIGEISLDRICTLFPFEIDCTAQVLKPTMEITTLLRDEFASLPEAAGQGMMAFSYLVGHLLASLLRRSGEGIEVTVKSHGLPIGAGLGSSAAFSVASSAACLKLSQQLRGSDNENAELDLQPENLKMINDWAFMAEILIHGTPSGLDNTTSTYGGMLKFIKKETGNDYESFRDIPQNLKILLTNTKVPRSTKELVSSVRKLYNSHTTVVNSIFHAIEEISASFLRILEEHQHRESPEPEASVISKIGDLVAINHYLLCSIGVGHPALAKVVDVSKSFGCSAKLTGAGGGGCAITLLHPSADVSLLSAEFRNFGYEVFESSIGGVGVKFH